MIRRPPRSTLDRSSAASDVYKRQVVADHAIGLVAPKLPHGQAACLRVDVQEGLGEVHRALRLQDGEQRMFGPEGVPQAEDGVHVVLRGVDLAVVAAVLAVHIVCLLYTSPSPRDRTRSRMPSSA